jgi:Xaa-Pro dipeptidase
VAGNPTDLQEEVHAVVRDAQERAISLVKPGVLAADVDEGARAVIRNAGHEKRFMHVTGHGVGFGYHELLPRIAPGSDDLLREGMVHSVEPGVYFPEMGGLRLEDDVLVTGDGFEVLGPYPRDLP